MSDDSTYGKSNSVGGRAIGGQALASTRLDLAGIGLDSTVYLKDVKTDSALTIAVHAADGELIAYAENAAEAMAWAHDEGFAVAPLH